MIDEKASDGSESASIRRAAEIELSSLVEMRRQLLDEHSAAFRWLVASLLAVNGGAAIAILNSPVIENSSKIGPFGCFFLGMIFALTTALVSQKANRSLFDPIGLWTGYWIWVAQTGRILPDRENELTAAMQAAMKNTRWTLIAGWLSALVFAAGVCWSGYQLLMTKPISFSASPSQPAQQGQLAVPVKKQ